MVNILWGIAGASVIWGIVSAIVMASYITKRGHKVNVLFFRLLIFKYIHQYSKITTQEQDSRDCWLFTKDIEASVKADGAWGGIEEQESAHNHRSLGEWIPETSQQSSFFIQKECTVDFLLTG